MNKKNKIKIRIRPMKSEWESKGTMSKVSTF